MSDLGFWQTHKGIAVIVVTAAAVGGAVVAGTAAAMGLILHALGKL